MLIKDVRVRDKVIDVEVNFHFYFWNGDNTLTDVPRIPGFIIDYMDAYTGSSYGDLAYTYEYMGVSPIRNGAYLILDDDSFVETLIESGFAYPTGLSKDVGESSLPRPLWVFKERFLKDVGGREYQNYIEAYQKFVEENGVGYKPAVSDEELKKVSSLIRG